MADLFEDMTAEICRLRDEIKQLKTTIALMTYLATRSAEIAAKVADGMTEVVEDFA